jgi:hypothetical protein
MLAPLALVGTLVVAGVLPTARAQTPLSETLPDSTLAYVEIAHFAQLREKFDQTQFGQMLKDEAMKPLIEEIESKLAEGNNEVKAELGFSLSEILDIPQGRIAVGVVPTPGANPPVKVIVSADAGKNDAKMAELMDRITKLAGDKGNAKVSTEEFNGRKLTVIQPNEGPAIVWSASNGIYTITLGVDAMQDAIKNADGRPDSLAKSDLFNKCVQKLGNTQTFFFLNLNAAVQLALENAPGGDQQIGPIIQALGVNNIKAFCGAINFADGRYDSQQTLFLLTPRPAQGIMRLFQMPQTASEPEAWVPANVASYSSLNWDFAEFYSGLEDIINMFAPGTLGVIEQQLAGAGEPISFQKDIFGLLANRISFATTTGTPGKPETQMTLVGVQLKDGKAFRATLNKLFTLAGAQPETRRFEGEEILEFPLPDVPNADQLGVGDRIGLVIRDDVMLFSTDSATLEQVIRGGQDRLADSDGFKAVRSMMPNNVSFISYTDAVAGAQSAYEMFKSGGLDEAFDQARAMGADLPRINDLFDTSKIPPFEVFKKYITPAGGYWIMDEDGLSMISFSARSARP